MIKKEAFAGKEEEEAEGETSSPALSTNSKMLSHAVAFEEFAFLVAEFCFVSNLETPTISKNQQTLFYKGMNSIFMDLLLRVIEWLLLL